MSKKPARSFGVTIPPNVGLSLEGDGVANVLIEPTVLLAKAVEVHSFCSVLAHSQSGLLISFHNMLGGTRRRGGCSYFGP